MTKRKDGGLNAGKWVDGVTPQNGWTCVGMSTPFDDAAAAGLPPVNSELCAMCECRHIVWVHTMFHPDRDSMLRVGTHCAGYMEGDVEAANAREKELRKRVHRAKTVKLLAHRFMTSPWCEDTTELSIRHDIGKGRKFNIRMAGFTLTVFQRRISGLWRWSFYRRSGHVSEFSQRAYKTAKEARADCVQYMQRQVMTHPEWRVGFRGKQVYPEGSDQ